MVRTYYEFDEALEAVKAAVKLDVDFSFERKTVVKNTVTGRPFVEHPIYELRIMSEDERDEN